jgi:hypothetical protein
LILKCRIFNFHIFTFSNSLIPGKMLTLQQKLTLFINSLGTFLVSFFIVKISIILVKYIVSWLFSIDTTLIAYRLMGISPADSVVWNISSIYSFYSAELVVSLVIFLRSFIIFRTRTDLQTQRRIFHLWLGFSAGHSFFSGIVSGMVTRSNVFHFLQWLYIPNHVLILIVFLLIPIMLLFGWFYNRQFIIASPVPENRSQLNDQRAVLFFSMFLPALAGILALFIPLAFSFHRYEFYEFLVLIVMAAPVMFYFFLVDYFRPSENFSKVMKFRNIYIAISISVIFLIINVLKVLLS